MSDTVDLDTDRIREWRSIITLIVFVLANLTVLFPFHIPVYLPRQLVSAVVASLRALRIVPKTSARPAGEPATFFVRFMFPVDLVTAPLIADLFLLAIHAIGRKEVHDGTIGANHIAPIDIMAFFITLAYIAISIDASGLIRWLAFKVLQKGGKYGHRLFFYMYCFFFGMACLVGNDPIVLSGTPFLSYLTRAAQNIHNEKAWIYAQFAMANIGSTVLVSSNPTNLVLAGAFGIKFIVYTANVIVPVIATVVLLFPFLLYVLFRGEGLVPKTIQMCELPDEVKMRKPANPNIPLEKPTDDDDDLTALSEILNPYLDRPSAIFGATLMGATLITILVLNAASPSGSEHPVYWVTTPAAAIMFTWDVVRGWKHRDHSRRTARGELQSETTSDEFKMDELPAESKVDSAPDAEFSKDTCPGQALEKETSPPQDDVSSIAMDLRDETEKVPVHEKDCSQTATSKVPSITEAAAASTLSRSAPDAPHEEKTLYSLIVSCWKWARQTFPTATTVLRYLPLKLVPFAFCMFILVEGLVTKGWVAVFAYGWNHWVLKTGVVGAIGGMAFLSVVLCNFAGTNIGTTILLCRVLQSWIQIRHNDGIPISKRMFWATVYSMVIGVNYGAFSTAFSASLAGLLWRDILSRKNIHVRSRDFAWINLPIIAFATIIGCVVLIGQVYITRGTAAYTGMS
ncbi:unnamed protein product [Zymoseptoria tritici ST99CH_3D7]|uniref:Citrate transporter-like domain-containing protein n=1 Tax=Zymoseptoria tritici (strain ST99CH_3D7) TaxID=1276538 RepID=A0A1X7RME6_ZYMT9|nr:unnamed protein product [Zymoseptoria tritici ST99CH_3D7]